MTVVKRTCSIEGCDRPHTARGWCSRHYNRWHQTGDPENLKPRTRRPAEARSPVPGSFIVSEKCCSRCEETKPASAFYVERRVRDGLSAACRGCMKDRSNQWYADNHERSVVNFRRAKLKNRYGLTLEDYEAKYVAQGGVCDVCGHPETMELHGAVKNLAVDHDHRTDEVRSLLCHMCNLALGVVDDDVDRLRKLALYLERWAAAPYEEGSAESSLD